MVRAPEIVHFERRERQCSWSEIPKVGAAIPCSECCEFPIASDCRWASRKVRRFFPEHVPLAKWIARARGSPDPHRALPYGLGAGILVSDPTNQTLAIPTRPSARACVPRPTTTRCPPERRTLSGRSRHWIQETYDRRWVVFEIVKFPEGGVSTENRYRKAN